MIMSKSKEWFLETELFNRHVKFPYAEHWLGYSILFMRLAMGWVLLQGGLTKVFDPSWSAEGFLLHAVADTNPFAEVFASLAGSPVVDFLVVWGLILTGVGVFFGVLLRFSAFWAAIMMFMFYLAALLGGFSSGLALEHGFVINEHIIYIAILWGLSTFGAGQIFGVDGWLRKQGVVKKHPWLNHFLG